MSTQGYDPNALNDDALAFDMPHRRQSHLLNTPCLISQHLIWHADDPLPAPGDELRSPYLDPQFNRPLITDAGDDRKAIAAVGVNRYLDHIFESADLGVNSRLRFTTDLKLCKESEGERRRLTETRHVPDTTFLNRTLAVSGDIDGLNFEVVVDIHQEYHTLCFRAFPLRRQIAAAGQTGRLHDDFQAAADWLALLSKRDSLTTDAGADEAIEAVFDRFWDTFYLKIADEHPEGAVFLFGQSQAVFRGVVLRDMEIEDQTAMHTDGPAASGEGGQDGLVISLLPDTAPEDSEGYDSLTPHPGNISPAAFGALLRQINNHRWFFGRFFGQGEKVSWIESARPTNSVMSGPADGLAVYGTDLGAHLPSNNQYPHKQVRFFLIYGGNSRDHLGRLVRRILYCGETRIAALKRFKYLRGVGKEILQLKEKYDDLTATPLLDGQVEEIREKIVKLDERLQLSVFRGPGIQKYLSRSQYYFRTLDKLILGLREARVLGWQTYGDFIDARLGATGEAIHSLQDDLDTLLLARERAERRIMLAENKAISKANQAITAALGDELKKIDKMQGQQVENSRNMRRLTVIILLVSLTNMLPVMLGTSGIFAMFLLYVIGLAYIAYQLVRFVFESIGGASDRSNGEDERP